MFTPGTPKPPNSGRKKGTPNKASVVIRENLTKFTKNNSQKLEEWLEQIDDPARRIELFIKIAEFVIPKLGRIEVQGSDEESKPIQVEYSFIEKELPEPNEPSEKEINPNENLERD